MTKSWEYITEQAINDDGMSNHEAIQFHFFNPNGIYAACKVMKDEIRRLVDLGEIKSGWLIAYDCQYMINQMYELNDKKRVSSIEFFSWRERFQRSIDMGYQALVERG